MTVKIEFWLKNGNSSSFLLDFGGKLVKNDVFSPETWISDFRHLPQLELLENLYILNSAYSFEEDRRVVLNKIMDYCMGVYCSQMMEWMTTGEVPVDKVYGRYMKDYCNISENWRKSIVLHETVQKLLKFVKKSDWKSIFWVGKS